MKHVQIAIDGPVAAGKGTVASRIAQKLDLLNIDTGAMYRAVALIGMSNAVDLQDEKKLIQLLEKTTLEVKASPQKPGTCEIFVNGENITDAIRTQQISWGSSVVATHPAVRRYLVAKQQEIAKKKSVVMEGRDIALRVLPGATIKVYLTADQKIRAKRRYEQLKQKGISANFDKILNETQKRDEQDTSRTVDPLKPVANAYILDTTDLSVNEVVNLILKKLNEKTK